MCNDGEVSILFYCLLHSELTITYTRITNISIILKIKDNLWKLLKSSLETLFH